MKNARDLAYLEMAYGLAEKARGWASPNPYVGAVVVKGGVIVGFGYHERPGKPHAEAIALERAGRRAKGGTLYLTLEPCVHWGRTPPCVDAVLNAGLRRVVISALDPNPLVFTKGVRRMRGAGIEVATGLLEDRNDRLNETYLKYITRKIPFVTLKAAMSLDGKIAARGGDSRWISSPESLDYAHLLRGECDAVMVGIETVLRDDPRLTVRHPAWKGKRTTRVILDSRLRFPLRAKLLSTLSKGNVLILTLPDPPAAKRKALERRGVEVVPLRGGRGRVGLEAALGYLGSREIASLLVEGGGRLLASFVERRSADKIFIFVAPRIIGGERAPSLIAGSGAASLKDALSLRSLRCFPIGSDIVAEGYF